MNNFKRNCYDINVSRKKQKNQITNIIIGLDISSSMEHKIKPLITTLNNNFLLNFSDENFYIYIHTFSKDYNTLIVEGIPSEINIPKIIIGGATPLYDTIVDLMNKYKISNNIMCDNDSDIILIIISDGEDNSSKHTYIDANKAIGKTKVFYIGYLGEDSLEYISNEIGAAYGEINTSEQLPMLMNNLSSTINKISQGDNTAILDFVYEFGNMSI